MDYMVDISGRVKATKEMVSKGLYFTINRPRQFGKSTLITALEKEISKDMYCAFISFEWSDEDNFGDPEKFCSSFISKVKESINSRDEVADGDWFGESGKTFNDLNQQITKLCKNRKVVLIIDEVDHACNYKVFITFISLLRDKFLQRKRGLGATFQSVILVGVHDIRNIKIKMINEGTYTPSSSEGDLLRSPWNIASPFLVDMSFSQADIKGMLQDYESDNATGMDIVKISEMIYDYTAGYPFLVSNICKMMADQIGWSPEGVIEAVKKIVKDSPICTLLDDVSKNILNYEEIHDFIYEILFEGIEKPFVNSDPLIQRSEMFGLIKEKNGYTVVSNKIFEVFISRLLASHYNNNKINKRVIGSSDSAIDENGQFSMELCLTRFAEEFRFVFTNDDVKFLEKNGRLVFIANLLGVTNGKGFYHIESQFTDRKKMDLVVDYGPNQYIIELKIWHGNVSHEKAFEQLRTYLNKKRANEGYLLTYDLRMDKNRTPKAEWVQYKDVRIYDVIV
jgi:hypothetical protein